MRTTAALLSTAIFWIVVMMGLAARAHAAPKVCTDVEAGQAQREADQLRDWNSVYRSFKRFAHCDQGLVGEEYSDSVSRLLVHDWKHLDELLRFTTSDRDFEQFVIRHIDETMSEDEAALIINNARLHCRPEARRLCRSIADY